jgi:hypothetical protein
MILPATDFALDPVPTDIEPDDPAEASPVAIFTCPDAIVSVPSNMSLHDAELIARSPERPTVFADTEKRRP